MIWPKRGELYLASPLEHFGSVWVKGPAAQRSHTSDLWQAHNTHAILWGSKIIPPRPQTCPSLPWLKLKKGWGPFFPAPAQPAGLGWCLRRQTCTWGTQMLLRIRKRLWLRRPASHCGPPWWAQILCPPPRLKLPIPALNLVQFSCELATYRMSLSWSPTLPGTVQS